MCVCVCVRGQERELPMVGGTPARANVPRRNMAVQLWDTSLCVDDEAEQTIDCKHSKWEFPIPAKVRTANC